MDLTERRVSLARSGRGHRLVGLALLGLGALILVLEHRRTSRSQSTSRLMLMQHLLETDSPPAVPPPANEPSSLAPYQAGRPPVPVSERATIPFCITPEALTALLGTVGTRSAETGAKCFGPATKLGIDTVEFDDHGSSHASGVVYAPDPVWGDARCAYWQEQPADRMKLWVSDAHSHPGWGPGYPSPKSGHGLGDLGYAEAVFAANPWMAHFFIPILTNTGRGGPVTITPWLVRREDPERPLLAELQVCAPEDFPERMFNSDWLAQAAD